MSEPDISLSDNTTSLADNITTGGATVSNVTPPAVNWDNVTPPAVNWDILPTLPLYILSQQVGSVSTV